MPQDDYYATHPLQELPPEEEPKEEPVGGTSGATRVLWDPHVSVGE